MRRQPDPDLVRQTRAAIGRLVAQRDAAARDAGRAMVGQAQVQHAVGAQRAHLAAAQAELAAAVRTAARVAEQAREQDGAAAAAPYELTLAGLRRQGEVLEQAVAQLDGLGAVSAQQVAQARRLLAETRRTVDAALAEQLRLLSSIEQLERLQAVVGAAARPPRSGR